VDRVASYTDENGLVRKLFDTAFKRLRRDYDHFKHLRPEDVRRAYFATQKVGKSGDEVPVDLALEEGARTKAQRDLEKQAYNLIMRDKERLLSFDESVSFIFAHSALKEGWDNPNVFQICTLNQTVSDTKKRQEIGRGLRLCVDQTGERIQGDEINVLTVVANESYRSYASRLQQEYVQDGDGSAAPPPPSDARRKKARRRDKLFVSHPDFAAFWEKLAQRVDYTIRLDTERLVKRCIERLNAERYPEPRIVIEKGEFVVHRYTITLESLRRPRARVRVAVESTSGDSSEYVRDVKEGDNIGDLVNDERLRGLVVHDWHGTFLVVGDDVELYEDEPVVYESAEGQQMRVHERRVAETRHPVFNVVARAAKETGLTRPTVTRIFRSLRADVKAQVLRNPEGFAGAFITVLRNVLADQVATSLEFRVNGSEPLELEELFPAEKSFPQKELVEAGARGLYDLVQKDSEVEMTFIERLKRDDAVVLFFKFPAAFKVRLPRLIGNYNPDWGIVRRDASGRRTLHLVRETKGSEKLETLRFPHERRKIFGASRYFDAAGVDYRPIAASTLDWWEPWRPEEELALE
jgi:type III restriction enzyme